MTETLFILGKGLRSAKKMGKLGFTLHGIAVSDLTLAAKG
jgi:hypothetical protein